jgi:hypothetical protein
MLKAIAKRIQNISLEPVPALVAGVVAGYIPWEITWESRNLTRLVGLIGVQTASDSHCKRVAIAAKQRVVNQMLNEPHRYDLNVRLVERPERSRTLLVLFPP